MSVDLSVVVPTRGRPERLRRLLECLSAQELSDGQRFEVVVALDGGDEASEAIPVRPPFDLEVLALPQVGISAAKNAAVAVSRGDVLLFVNDDVEPAPTLVREHLAAQRSGEEIVLGCSPWMRFARPTVFNELIAASRMIFFYGQMEGGRRYGFRHAWNLNLSVQRGRLNTLTSAADRSGAAAGPFDERFRPCMYEDIELAHRLMGERHDIFYHPAARAVHHHRYTLAGYFEREAMLGVMAPQLAASNPACFAAVFGGLLEEVAARARRRLDGDVIDQRRALEQMSAVTSREWQEFRYERECDMLLSLLYSTHLPLKRRAFRLGLLAALDGADIPWQHRQELATGTLQGDEVFELLGFPESAAVCAAVASPVRL